MIQVNLRGTQDGHLPVVAAGKASWLALGAVLPSNVPGENSVQNKKKVLLLLRVFLLG